MSGSVFISAVLGLALVLTARAGAPAPDKAGKKNEPVPLIALRIVVPEFEEIPADPITKFTNILRSLSQKMDKEYGLDLQFEINMRAFEADGLKEEVVLDLSPVADKPLPGAKNISFERYLQRLLARVEEKGAAPSGVTFLVRRDVIEITTFKAVRKQVWGDHPGPFFPLIHATFDKSLLSDALNNLAEQSEHNIVLDVRVGEKAKTPVTARLFNTPLDTAVKLLAEMADLAIFQQDNVIYVTTRENAAKLKSQQKKEKPKDTEGKRAARVGVGARGFVPREAQSPME
jgi:hypothetical protein